MFTSTTSDELSSGTDVPSVMGNYEILDRLGGGGMGQVFKARHRRMKRIVALKTLPATSLDSQQSVTRFEREVEAAGKLEHPNIVSAYDADEDNGVHFLVMQFVDGIDLASLIDKWGPIDVGDAVHCIIEAAKGLAYAHGKGLVHRDVKPANLILGKDGTLQVLDMGLAWNLPSTRSDRDDATERPPFMGTADFLPPERIYDAARVDPRSDIYALGCTLYYLIGGRTLYERSTAEEKIRAHCELPPPSLLELRSDIPAELQSVYAKMVAKDVADRFQTAEQVVEALQACGIVYEEAFDSLRQSVFAGPEHSELDRSTEEGLSDGGLSDGGLNAASSVAAAEQYDDSSETMDLPGAQPRTFPAPKRPLAILIGLTVLLVILPVVLLLFSGPRPDGIGNDHPSVEAHQRQAARWVLDAGGTLQIEVDDHWETVNQLDELPPGPFRIHTVQLGGNSNVTDEALAYLAELSHLEMLWLGNTDISDDGLAHLAGLTELRYLSLSETKLTDEGLRHLRGLSKLHTLRLAKTGLTDSGMQQLDTLQRLALLDISNTAVSDVGLLELRSMPELSELILENTDVTEDGIGAFNKVHPTCRVRRDDR